MVFVKGALCAKMAQPDVLEIFYPERRGNNDQARELCYRCPVLDNCRELTLLDDLERRLVARHSQKQSSLQYGFAGAMGARERQEIITMVANAEEAGQPDRGIGPVVAPTYGPAIHFGSERGQREMDRAERLGKWHRLRVSNRAGAMPEDDGGPGRLVHPTEGAERDGPGQAA